MSENTPPQNYPPPSPDMRQVDDIRQEESPIIYTMWGPPEPKKTKPVGMGDVFLGFFYSLVLFGAIPALAIITLITVMGRARNQPAGEIEAQIFNTTESAPFLVLFLLLSWLGFLFAVWRAGTRKGDKNLKELIKWRFSWKRDILIAIIFTIGFRAIEILASAILRFFGINTEELSNSGFLLEQSGFWLVIIALGAIFGAPLVEEIFFRGLFLTVAVKNWGKVVGVIVTSLAFGVLHLQTNIAASTYTIISTSILGAALAILVLKTNRLGTAIVTHTFFNASGVALVLLAAQFNL